MSDCYRVEVAAREASFDADGREALQHLKNCGLTGVTAVRSARVYRRVFPRKRPPFGRGAAL